MSLAKMHEWKLSKKVIIVPAVWMYVFSSKTNNYAGKLIKLITTKNIYVDKMKKNPSILFKAP